MVTTVVEENWKLNRSNLRGVAPVNKKRLLEGQSGGRK